MTTANRNAIGIVNERKGKIIKRNGSRMFSGVMPKATRTSESRTSCETTRIALITHKEVKNCGKTSFKK